MSQFRKRSVDTNLPKSLHFAVVSEDLHPYLYYGIHLQAAAKFLERIGDHITNLAELVIFMVWGKDIRHTGKLSSGDASVDRDESQDG